MAKAPNPAPRARPITQLPIRAVIFKMRDIYLAKAAADPTNDPAAAEAIRDHFDRTNATLRAWKRNGQRRSRSN